MDNIISPSNNFSVVVSDSMYETILNTPLEEAKGRSVYRLSFLN